METKDDPMPCAECGHLLLVSHEHEDLRCPQCIGLDLPDPEAIQEKVERDRELFSEERLLIALKEYSKTHLLLFLMERLNHVGTGLYDQRRINQREFSYINYLIKIIFPEPEEEFGNKHLERGHELDEEIKIILDGIDEVLGSLSNIEDDFKICINYEVTPPNTRFLFEEYEIYDSEYRYCFWRCLRSLMAGKPEETEIFDKTDQQIRDFDTLPADEIESLTDFANIFFEFILALLFVASAEDIVQDIYTTFPPDDVTVFDIQNLLNELDHQFINEEDELLLQDSTLGWTNEEGLDKAGNKIFSDDWEDVKGTILVSEDNLDPHPFLFKLEVDIPFKNPSGRPPLTRTRTRIVYPRYYDKILQYQIFPLLNNGEQPSGHEILSDVCTVRGRSFERNIHAYLADQGLETNYSAEIPSVESSEIDVLAINHSLNELWFIECKYLLPELKMYTAEGIENLNAKFDHKVFNEDTGGYTGSPTGQPFPYKVDEWLDLEPGAEFICQDSRREEIQKSWLEMQPRKMVVSNLVPSYLEKHGVEFLTDMELVELIEDESNIYTPRQEMV